jgi:hypothetical protein
MKEDAKTSVREKTIQLKEKIKRLKAYIKKPI